MDQDIISELRRRGYRITTARRAVLSSLVGATGHLTADQVAHTVKATNPDVDTSTVYRTLGLFEDLGIVEHAHLGHGPAVYHLGKTHQHLVCEECGTVIDVPVEALDALARELRQGYGFQIRPGHFALTGRCDQHTVSE
jgi:Fur family ferric uptake transcriptional regulator